MEYCDGYKALMGIPTQRILNREIWSCPDAETYITGIDYFDHPKACREKMKELYPWLGLGVPETDDPIPRPELSLEGKSSDPDTHAVRWGAGTTATWKHGEGFETAEDVFAFSPLEYAQDHDWTERNVVVSGDFSSEEAAYQHFRKNYPEDAGDTAPEGSTAGTGFYNTMFMWPMLTFDWELFLECCLDERFERIMDEFAEINRRVFKAFARLPVNFVTCHDDIVTSRGAVCSPQWMHKYIFPRYEEFWGIVKAAGKEVIFMVDGCIDPYADDVIACGARGIITEPYTDFKAIAGRHARKNLYLSGEGDNRILNRNNPEEIDAMVDSMVATGKMSGGYVMSVGNHIPWNCSPQGIKHYFDACEARAYR